MFTRTNRRHAWRAALLSLALVVAALVPATALADGGGVGGVCGGYNGGTGSSPCGGARIQYQWVHPWAGFQGWGAVRAPNACPVGAACFVAASTPAFRWNGAWNRASLAGNETQVYVYPFAEGWSWVWTRSTGWLAVQDRYVFVPTTGPVTV